MAQPATTTKFVPLIISAVKQPAHQLSDLATTVANSAQSFTTKELSFERGTGESLTLTRELCFADGANDTSPLCLTNSQVSALLSQTAGAAASISVPPPPSNISEPPATDDPPISVSSTSTPDTAPEPAVEEPQTEASAAATPDAANDDAAATEDYPESAEPANDNDAPELVLRP